MGLITFLIVGLLGGALAKLIMPGKQGGGFLPTLILGVIGALLGGWIGSLLFNKPVTGFDLGSIAMATVGSLIVAFAWAAFQRRSVR